MHDATELLKLIKQAALEVVAASIPVSICVGTVLSSQPLKVKLDQKLTLTNGQLIKCKEIGNIKADDSLILIRRQGGQKYIILGVM